MPRPSKKGNQPDPANFFDPQSILDNAPVGVFTSTPDGRYIAVNHTTAEMLGYENPHELISSITDIASQVYADPADRIKFMRLMEKCGEVLNHECRFRRRDGTEFWVSRNARVLKDENGRIVAYQGFNTDITDSKQTERALRESEQR
ncbi:MAG: PAS domain S-box protein, partial [Desulfonatronovibrio sp. MSAO_Bac4]